MVSNSSRLSLLALTLYLSSVVLAEPYAPDLYSRSDLLQDGTSKRNMAASRPYAPDLFARSNEDLIQVKRSVSPNLSTSWSSVDFLTKRSEEELHARGKVDDAIIEKRGRCNKDSQCGSKYYCSTTRNQCYQLLNIGTHCSRDGACSTNYCCETTSKCKEQKPVGSTCHQNNGACQSGYCSVNTNLCREPASKGQGCSVDDGCKGNLNCVNRTCTNPSKPSHSSSPSKPTHTSSPSGSVHDKRELRRKL